ncbi:MAG: hypothetical protein SGI86_12475 [Deltaproteobacteria bacterium]|nr:hypothetical protein [Deltaproteobacteria bacterium]
MNAAACGFAVALFAGQLVACTDLDLGSGAYFHDEFEGDDLTSWQRAALGTEGGVYAFPGGSVQLVNNQAHSGKGALQLALEQLPGRLENAGVFRVWTTPQVAYFGAYLMFPRTHTVVTGIWTIFQYRGQSTPLGADVLYEIRLRNRTDGQMEMVLFHESSEIAGTFIDPVAPNPSVAPNQWFHLEARVQRSDAASGRLTFWRDGQLLFDVANVKTTLNGGRSMWFLTSVGADIVPGPVIHFVDDATLTAVRWHPISQTPH